MASKNRTNGRYSKDNKERVIESLTQKGFLLEMKTAEIFQKAKWMTSLQRWFYDVKFESDILKTMKTFEKTHDDGFLGLTPREIDIVAVDSDLVEPPGIFSEYSITLVLDCKRQEDDNWVFAVKDRYKTSISQDDALASMQSGECSPYQYLQHLPKLSNNGDEYYSPTHKKLLTASHHSYFNLKEIGYAYTSAFKKDAIIRGACEQIISALEFHLLDELVTTKYEVSNPGEYYCYWRIYPVIVFEGSMWKIKQGTTKPILKPADIVTLNYSRRNESFLIDFVRFDALNKYLKILRNEMKQTRDALISK